MLGEKLVKSIASWLLVGAACTCACRADQSSIHTGTPIAVTVSEPGEFGVVYHRTTPPGVGAVVAGLVGVAVQQGILSSEDNAMAHRVIPKLSDPSCGSRIAAAMDAELAANGGYMPGGAADDKRAAADIDVKDCGLRLVDSGGMQVASYVSLRLKYKPAEGKGWTEDIQVSGRNRHPFDDFANQDGLAQSELEDVLNRAGRRAADKIIYQKL